MNDMGVSSDTYRLGGSTVTATADGGGDAYNMDVIGGGNSTVDDHGDSSDSYTVSGNGTVLLNEMGDSSEAYSLGGSTVTVADDGGGDAYNIDVIDGGN